MADGTADRARRAFFLNRQARCLASSGRQEQAVAAYREQLRTGQHELTSAGIPLEIQAWHQVGNILFRQGRMEEAAEAFLELYRGLLESRWPLTRDQFDFFRNWAEDRFQATLTGMEPALRSDREGRFRDLEQEGRGRLEETRIRETVVERIIPRIRLDAGNWKF